MGRNPPVDDCKSPAQQADTKQHIRRYKRWLTSQATKGGRYGKRGTRNLEKRIVDTLPPGSRFGCLSALSRITCLKRFANAPCLPRFYGLRPEFVFSSG